MSRPWLSVEVDSRFRNHQNGVQQISFFWIGPKKRKVHAIIEFVLIFVLCSCKYPVSFKLNSWKECQLFINSTNELLTRKMQPFECQLFGHLLIPSFWNVDKEDLMSTHHQLIPQKVKEVQLLACTLVRQAQKTTKIPAWDGRDHFLILPACFLLL